MSYTRIFCLFLCTTVLSPVYGMELIQDESKSSKCTSPKPSGEKFPVELGNDEILQLFEKKQIITPEGFRISLKEESPSQDLKNKALLLRAKNFAISAVGAIDIARGQANTMVTEKNSTPGNFVKYRFHIGEDRIPQYEFLTSVAKIALQLTPETLTENSISTAKPSSLKKLAPSHFILESAYLNYIVNLLLDLQQPMNASLKDSEKAMMLLYSYPFFTTEKNLFSLLNIFKETYVNMEQLKVITNFLNQLKERGLPNGPESLKAAEDEFNALANPLNWEDIKPSNQKCQGIAVQEIQDNIKGLNEMVKLLKAQFLKNNRNEENKKKGDERQFVLNLIESQEVSFLDLLDEDFSLERFMDALLRRDLALSRVPLKNFANDNTYEQIITQASQTSDWVALQALTHSNINNRKAVYHKFCLLFREFIKKGNFNCAFQIAAGISQPAMWRVIEEDMKLPGQDKTEVVWQYLPTLKAFADPEGNLEGYCERVNDYIEKNQCDPWPYFGVTSQKKIHLLKDFPKLCKPINTNEDKIEKQNIIKGVADLLKAISNYPTSPHSFEDDTYLKAVCSISKIHQGTLEVYADLLYPSEEWRKAWILSKQKALEDWEPQYFACLLRQNKCGNLVKVCFDNNVCNGKDIIHWVKVQKLPLAKIGGRYGLSQDMIKCITSALRKVKAAEQNTEDMDALRKTSTTLPLKKSAENVDTTTAASTTIEGQAKAKTLAPRKSSKGDKSPHKKSCKGDSSKINIMSPGRKSSGEKTNTNEPTSTKAEEMDLYI